MSNDAEFIPGLIAKAPNERAPDFIKARLSIKRLELIAYLQSLEDDWVNGDVKVSQGGKWYVQKDNWKPQQGGAQRQEPPKSTGGSVAGEDDIPFAPLSKRSHW